MTFVILNRKHNMEQLARFLLLLEKWKPPRSEKGYELKRKNQAWKTKIRKPDLHK